MADTFKSDWKVLSGSSDDFGFTVKPSASNGGIAASDFHQWENDYVTSVDAAASCGTLAVDTTRGYDDSKIKSVLKSIDDLLDYLDGLMPDSGRWKTIRSLIEKIKTLGKTLTNADDVLDLLSILASLLLDFAIEAAIGSLGQLELEPLESAFVLKDLKRAVEFATDHGGDLGEALNDLTSLLSANDHEVKHPWWDPLGIEEWLSSFWSIEDWVNWLKQQGILNFPYP